MEKTEDQGSGALTPGQSTDDIGEKDSPPSPTPDVVPTSPEESVKVKGAVESAEEEQEYLSGFKLYVVIFSITLLGFLMLLDTSIVATAVPRITSDFHSLGDVGWYGTAYLLANCALQPLTGKIYTYYNTKGALFCFFGLFELGSLICGAAISSKMLIVGRAIAGLGSSGILNGGYTLVHACVPLPKQPFYLSTVIGICQLGVIAGPLLGGVLTQYVSWRWCFYINLPCGGAVATLLFFVSLPDHTNKTAGKQSVINTIKKLDPIGFSLFAPATIQLILALEWGGMKYPWNSPTVIGLFCGAFGTLLIFLVWEYRKGNEAMIPFYIIGKRAIWSSGLNYGCFMGAMMLSTYYLPIYFQSVRNASPTLSGVDLLPSILSTILFGMICGVLVGKIGYYLPFAVASGVLHTIGMGLLTTLSPTTAVRVWIGYQIILGAGRGMGFQMPIIAVQNNSSKADVSVATGIAVFSQNLGAVIFLSLGQVIFINRLKHGLAIYAPEVNPDAVIAAGATAFRSVVQKASYPGVILAYSKAFDQVAYLATGVAGASLVFAFGMRWMSIKKTEVVKPTSEPEV